jgi:hypothetical protein
MKRFLTALVVTISLGAQYCVASAMVICGSTNPLNIAAANNIPADLQLDLIMGSAMRAFKETLTPLAMFSTVWRDIALQGKDTVQVPYYPLETAASRDFNGTYQFDGSTLQSKPLVIDRRKYQSLSFTSAELARQPQFDPEVYGRLKGQQLAEDVLADIWGLITNANYGAAIFTGAAGSFDVDSVIDIETAVIAAKWPAAMRSLILKPAYIANLKKDINASGGMATYNRDVNGALETFPMIESFSLAHSNVIPANGEALVGFAVHPSAILIGFSPITPAPAVMKRLADYRIESDDDLGIALEYREWGDADDDTEKRTIEVNYGRALGELAALKRIVSA